MSEASRGRSRTPPRTPRTPVRILSSVPEAQLQELRAELARGLGTCEGRNEKVLKMSAATHIKAYMNVSGQQMGLAGVGCAHGKALDTWGLIPSRWTAQQLTATQHWWRILPTTPKPGEEIRVRTYGNRLVSSSGVVCKKTWRPGRPNCSCRF